MSQFKASIRSTFFTNKPIELDYEKAMKIANSLSSYKLFPAPVTGFSFQIGPTGMIPTAMNSFEFRNGENLLNISIGPNRVDINHIVNKKTQLAFADMSDLCQNTIQAFSSCIDYRIVRLALASTWVLAEDNLSRVQSDLVGSENNSQLIEWDKHFVNRSVPKDVLIPINYGWKIARAAIKLPTDLTIKDRIFLETDINTIPLPPEQLPSSKVKLFFNDAINASIDIIKKYIHE